MSKLDRLGWAVCNSYRFGEAEVSIRTTSPAFSSWMQEVFAPYRADHDAEPGYSIVIGGSENGSRGYHILYRGIVPVVRTLHLPALARGLLTEAESARFHERDDAVYVRWATVEVDGKTALVSPFLAAQLGTLGRRVQRAGVTLGVTDFTAVALDDAEIVPIAPSFDIPEDSIDRLPADLVGGASSNADRLVIDRPRSVDAVFVTSGGQLMEPISRAAALQQVAASALNLSVLGQRGLEALAGLMAEARCYRLGAGDMQSQLEAMTQAVGA